MEEVSYVENGKVETEPNVHLYYELYGNGEEKVLLVMGLATSAIAWLANVKQMVLDHPEFQFCIYDNRGVGRSSVPSGRYKTSIMAQDGIRIADYLKWEQFHVAGISMGGMISQEIALLVPKRVSTLNLAVTHSGGTGSYPQWEGIKGIYLSNRAKTGREKVGHMMDLMYTDDFLSKEVEEGITNKEKLTTLYLEAVKKLPKPSIAGFASQIFAVQTHSVGAKRLSQLKTSGIPILICTGDTDKLVNPQASLFLKSVLDPVEFILWENTGHGVITQQFEEYNKALIRHCKRNRISLNSQL